jgi:hypothetical protein
MPMPQSTAAASASSAAAAASTTHITHLSLKSTAGSSSSDTRAVRDTGMRAYAAAVPGSIKSSGPAAAVGTLATPLLVPAVPTSQQQRNAHPHPQQQPAGSSQQDSYDSSNVANEQPGKAKRVAPSGQEQKSWYAAAWHWFRSAVWGTPVDLMQLGPPWTKWPGGWFINRLHLRALSVCSALHSVLLVVNAALPCVDVVCLAKAAQHGSALQQQHKLGMRVLALLAQCAVRHFSGAGAAGSSLPSLAAWHSPAV